MQVGLDCRQIGRIELGEKADLRERDLLTIELRLHTQQVVLCALNGTIDVREGYWPHR